MFVGFLILATITSEVLKELNKRKNNETKWIRYTKTNNTFIANV
jgi:hypothetical protein